VCSAKGRIFNNMLYVRYVHFHTMSVSAGVQLQKKTDSGDKPQESLAPRRIYLRLTASRKLTPDLIY
jgi:hypothetical protein